MPQTQEHLEICDGTKFERRGVRVSEVMGRLIFWSRMTQKMTQKMATVTSTPEVHIPDAPSGGSSTTLLWVYASRSCRLLDKLNKYMSKSNQALR